MKFAFVVGVGALNSIEWFILEETRALLFLFALLEDCSNSKSSGIGLHNKRFGQFTATPYKSSSFSLAKVVTNTSAAVIVISSNCVYSVSAYSPMCDIMSR